MSVFIAGMGWVTPLGSGVSAVWDRLLKGEEARDQKISNSAGSKSYSVFRVPESAVQNLPSHPRLRRASAISRYAVAAGLAALDDARSTIANMAASRIALVFAISNGGVIYTRRFYHDIVASGAQSASPLLFPETVFNAPASHLAAILGVTGSSYTVVGDGAVGLVSIRMAEDLMINEGLDYCLVVGAEEADWLLCDAYDRWRLLRSAPPIEPFRKPPKGMILSEGAGAILLARKGAIRIDATSAGGIYPKQREASEFLKRLINELATAETRTVIASANGTFIDDAESRALSQTVPLATIYTVKPALGESVGAGGLWQIIIAAQALRSGRLPPLLRLGSNIPLQVPSASSNTMISGSALVLTCGLNQQVAGLRLSIQ